MQNKLELSIILGCRNEFPLIVSTIYSFREDLLASGISHEFIVVDNGSDDATADILEDRMRRWVRAGLLRVVRYNERAANVLVRNVGAREAKGDALIFADAHLSVVPGSCAALLRGWRAHGGLVHPSIQQWGDSDEIRCRGYQLKLEQKFWGNLSREVPKEILAATGKDADAPDLPDYQVPMASHCCLMAGSEEFLDFGGYCERFRCYGGGEPYLDLKWWLFGSTVWLCGSALVRHAFGHVASWRKVGSDRKLDHQVYTRSGELKKELKAGEEHLHYSRGYAWTNEELHHNFLVAAYAIGGYAWLQRIYRVYWDQRKGNSRYVEDLKDIRREVLRDCHAERESIARRQKLSLDELLERQPWRDSYSRVQCANVCETVS